MHALAVINVDTKAALLAAEQKKELSKQKRSPKLKQAPRSSSPSGVSESPPASPPLLAVSAQDDKKKALTRVEFLAALVHIAVYKCVRMRVRSLHALPAVACTRCAQR